MHQLLQVLCLRDAHQQGLALVLVRRVVLQGVCVVWVVSVWVLRVVLRVVWVVQAPVLLLPVCE